jgi:hypothetical protein
MTAQQLIEAISSAAGEDFSVQVELYAGAPLYLPVKAVVKRPETDTIAILG